ncbi:MAG TPA: secretin N-terminal domain-containing protein [Allosphingosinicella sp.]|nr:secretin N-terminal domain-containing protein [Allosphingosinicella sp.]
MAVPQVPAVAQSDSSSIATTRLTNVQLIAEGLNQSVFQISFSPRTGSYSAVASDPTRPALMLLRTSRAPELDARKEFRGLVRSVDIEPSDSGLAIRFNATGPAKVVAEASGTERLLVTVSRLTGAEAVGSRPIGSSDETVVPATALPEGLNPPPGEDGYELVMLKYADVSEIVGLLTEGITVKPNNVFIRREPGFGSPATSGGTTYVSPQTQSQQEDRPLGQSVDQNLAIDRRLNAIWIKGSPERIARIKEQIALIDVPVDSVILETQFVELTETGARNIGIDLANANGQIAFGSLQTGGVVPFGLDPNKIVPTGAIQAAIYAQIQKGNGRIVSKPRIAAQSGATAKIITGDALPILTAITLSGVNGVSQQVQYVNVGVTLQIAPRVSSDGYVTSHIYGVVSSVTGYSQGYPTISQREAETSASVRDGETFVIGGLTQDNSLTTKSKVPLLGDIPLLGQAFRVEKTGKSRTELYIVITPHIVRHRRFEALDAMAPPTTIESSLPPRQR